jgi:hypothetical protein
MDGEYVEQFVEDVIYTSETLKKKEVAESDKAALVAAIQMVDAAHKDNGLPGFIRKANEADWEEHIQKNCIKGVGFDGPDVYCYAAYTEPDDPKSNTGGFTTHQLEEFAKTHHGLPVYLSHETHLGPIGITVGGAINKKGELMGGFVLYDNAMGRLAHDLIEKMGMRGVSLGSKHKQQVVDGVPYITHACVTEVSICCLGDQKGTWMKFKVPWAQLSKGADAEIIKMMPDLDI